MSTTGMGADVQNRIAAHRSAVLHPAGMRTGRLNDTTTGVNSTAFGKIYESKVNEIRFSAHAATRIKSRNIAMSPEVLNKLETAVQDAAKKGARDSLIMLDNSAFIVNIPNRMVVTAMDGNALKNNVFTNIDSAVIVN